MKEIKTDVTIIGGGPAGLTAASTCREIGLGNIVLIEKEEYLGGILPQCIHTGFGITEKNDELTGPEFAENLIEFAKNSGVEFHLGTYANKIQNYEKGKIKIECIGPNGLELITTTCLIYATGCRERNVFEIGICGDRPAGIFTAGTTQTLMDVYGLLPGKRVVVVGSGDVGLIMSRRLALEGVHVEAVVEMLPFPGGLTRNIIQCLHDFNIPLLLSHAVLEIYGNMRVESVMICQVNELGVPLEGTEREIKCDTVVIAAGLLPEVGLLQKANVQVDMNTGGPIVNEFLETSLSGVFVCGNVLVVNDLVDHAVEQGKLCAKSTKSFIDGELNRPIVWKRMVSGDGIRFTVPHLFSGESDVVFYTRVKKPLKKCQLSFKEISTAIKLTTARPVEMIRFSLKNKVLHNVSDKLTVELKKDV